MRASTLPFYFVRRIPNETGFFSLAEQMKLDTDSHPASLKLRRAGVAGFFVALAK